MYLLTIIYVYLILCQNHSLLRNVALIGITQMIMSMITPFMTISKKKMFSMNQLYRAPSSFPGPFGGVGKRPWERG